MRFGDTIKRARKDRFSQQTLGEQIGVWGTYIGQIEKGERVPSDELCLQLAKVLDLEPQKLLISAYRERAQTKEAQQLFAQMEKLMADPVISEILADPKLLDAAIIQALQQPGIRRAIKNAKWRDALSESASMADRDIPELIHLIKRLAPQQWEALLGTAKAFAGVT